MGDRRRVVLDALLVRPRPTGVGRSILELTNALAGTDRRLEFIVLATHPEMFGELDRTPHWRVHACAGARGGTLRKAWFTQTLMPGLVRRLGGDLLHCLQFVAPVRKVCPTVVTVHDLGFLRFPGTVEQPRRAYYRLLVPHTLSRCNRIVTNSAATAAEVAELFPETAGRITVTPFGTPSWVQGRTAPGPERQGDAPFLFVGTLEPRKNLDRLLEAYAVFLRRGAERDPLARLPDLVLAGASGWHGSRLRAQISRLREQGKLHLVGYCEPDELWSLYTTARALLFPSLHEGFGFPVLEAMAAGLPVMTSDRGAMREVAADAALLVDPEDASEIAKGLEGLHLDSSLRADLAERGRLRLKAWNWDRTAAATVEVYRELLEGDKGQKQA